MNNSAIYYFLLFSCFHCRYWHFWFSCFFSTCCNLNYSGSGGKLPSIWGKIPSPKAYFILL